MEETSHEELTFKEYASSQAQAYAAQRGAYHERLFDVILNHHRTTGGSFGVLLDVGCGPGNSTRPLAKHFDVSYGLDPSPEMVHIATRIEEGIEIAGGKRTECVCGRTENMTFLKESGQKVDLLTAATSVRKLHLCATYSADPHQARWFDLQPFWALAAQVLNPGGTVALWLKAFPYCHPLEPNAKQIKQVMDQVQLQDFAPHNTQGNILCSESYDNLLKRWDAQPPIAGFAQTGVTKIDWVRNGRLSDGEHFFLGDEHVTLTQVEKMLGTASPVTRWREGG